MEAGGAGPAALLTCAGGAYCSNQRLPSPWATCRCGKESEEATCIKTTSARLRLRLRLRMRNKTLAGSTFTCIHSLLVDPFLDSSFKSR